MWINILVRGGRQAGAPRARSMSMMTGAPMNEPVLDYTSADNSKHRVELEKCLRELEAQVLDVPIVIGGEEYKTDDVRYQRCPFNHKEKVACFYYATHELIHKAVEVSLNTRRDWATVPAESKMSMLERAADLVSGKYRQKLNAATMMGQGKTVKQAEIDSAAEMADFFRFNAHYLRRLLHASQPKSTEFERNEIRFQPLDGFVAAISPFNFTAIGANLASAPALMGNCVVWKPSDTAVLSNYVTLQLLREAGFPDGVLNFVPSEGLDFGRVITGHRGLAGLNFTGSLATFQWLWAELGLNVKRYKTFPRLVGECGGKNFHLVHKSAHVETVVAQTIRSAFEYSGQKCSACSRLYVPSSLWPQIRDQLLAILSSEQIKVGPATDFDTFTSAVIDASAFKRISSYISYAKSQKDELKLLAGGEVNDEIGYFVEPTIIETKNPENRLMMEEIFGPVLTVFVYPDSSIEKTLDLISSHPFALTGAIFAQDESFIEHASDRLRMNAGNLYINDKSTGAVVGQQPFGGWRHSGTNDKAGGAHYLMRWCNQQTVKTTTKLLVEI